jgi:hypothetical protein
MVRKGKLASLLLAVAVLAACSSISTTEDYDRATNFSRYKTYEWKTVDPIQNQILEQRLKSAVETTLNSKGLRTSAENPDLWVVPHTRLDKQTQINTYNSGWGYGYGWRGGYGGGMTTSTVSEIPVGTLIIDLVDAGKKQMVWRGTASKTLEPDASPETKDKNIATAVQKMFANYPPGAGK